MEYNTGNTAKLTCVIPSRAHAGRKAWSAKKGVGPAQPIAPSAVSHDADWVVPHALTLAEIDNIVSAFRASAKRALAAGFDAIELHSAHGYLLHEFLSPISNRRADEYGGTLANCARLLFGVVEAVRGVLPEPQPLLVRLSCTDWVEGGLTIDDEVQVARWLKARGVDMVDCSSGGVTSVAPPAGPGYQVPFADKIRHKAGIATMAVGPKQYLRAKPA